jgi:LAO/AO transport system kinase
MTDLELTSATAALLQRFRNGERIALARAISLVESERPGFQAVLHNVLTEGLRARRTGITGPPGAGKSTLVAALATACTARGEEIGVVAVDPTSPFSGGALLGDRIRMNDIAMDPGIFIRSMASRGSLGGLATTTKEVIDLMDAFGFDRTLVETVGVGQTELEITGATDTVVVVLVPESGDGIQAMKAGLMEIADIFVVNKADRPGADRLVKEIRTAIHFRTGKSGFRSVPAHHGVDHARIAAGGRESEARDARPGDAPDSAPAWTIPVLTTIAQTGEGVPALLEAIDAHGEHLRASGELEQRRRARAERRIRDVVDRELKRVAWRSAQTREIVEGGVDGVLAGDETPYSLARQVVARLLR